MTTESMADKRPDALHGAGSSRTEALPASAAREERLNMLYARWKQFEGEYGAARERNDQEVMTNLRGLMLLIKREIRRLGGELPAFPYPEDPHLADL